MARRLSKKSLPPAAEWFDLHKLKGWQNNPKVHNRKNLDKIKASLKEFGWGRTIVARRTDLEIVAGHGTTAAALELYDEGFKSDLIRDPSTGPVRFVDLDTKRAHGLAMADNKIAESSTWDKQLLPIAMADLKGTPSIFEATGFKFKDVFGSEASGAPKTEDDEESSEPEVPVTQLGDVWELGDHKLACGDSFDTKIRSLILDRKQIVDCVVTDPPYAIFGSSSGTGPDIADDAMILPFFDAMWRMIRANLKEFGHAYISCDWRSWASIWQTCKRAGVEMAPKNMIVWDKMNAGLGSMYSNAFELVFFAARVPPSTALKSTTERGNRVVHHSNIVRYPRVQGDERQDNAAKPVDMLKVFIENSTDEGQTIVDYFAGSGTTLIACELTKRRALTFDKEPKKCDVIVRRWEKRTGRKAKRIHT